MDSGKLQLHIGALKKKKYALRFLDNILSRIRDPVWQLAQRLDDDK
jgi:hypothetical protein